MKIAVIGAAGRAGSRILKEGQDRKHEMISISKHEGATIKKDLFDLTIEDLKDVDVVISAFGSWEDMSLHTKVPEFLDKLMTQVGKPWYMVGGAGSLLVSEDMLLVNTPDFPEEYFSVAQAMGRGLDYLRSSGRSKWSYFSPAALFEPGEKTGHYKLGEDYLLTDELGNSYISMEDYAVAMLDVVEQGKYINKRFTAIKA